MYFSCYTTIKSILWKKEFTWAYTYKGSRQWQRSMAGSSQSKNLSNYILNTKRNADQAKGNEIKAINSQNLLSDILPPANYTISPKEFQQLRTKFSNTWSYGGHSHSTHHSRKLELPSLGAAHLPTKLSHWPMSQQFLTPASKPQITLGVCNN